MKYYKIRSNYNTRSVVHYSELQIEDSDYYCDIFGPHSISSYYGKKLEPNNVILPDIKLNTKATPTDLIDIYSVAVAGLGANTLVVSTKLRNIIMQYADASWTSMRIKLIHRKSLLLNYWLIHGFQDRSDLLDYQQTKFHIRNTIGPKLNEIKIGSHYDLLKKEAELVDNRQLLIKENIRIDEAKSPADILYLTFTAYFLPTIFVSPRLKLAIEMAACTGIDFEAC